MSSPDMTRWLRSLRAMGACSDAVAWAETQPSPEVLWASCERGDWMLWLVGRLEPSAPWSDERKPMVACALECARLALPHVKGDAARVCIETHERWIRGDATRDECERARMAAAEAAAANASAAYDDAAADAANAATYAAARAARAAAADVADAAAYAAARSQTLKACADIVRRHYPTCPLEARS